MFATATAIRPDILIVDEVLGAGDAYFVAKSKARVEKLVSSGCTMLLVSHSMQQVLELCDEAIWLDKGQIRMQGESFLVVKAYEEYLHGPLGKLTSDNFSTNEVVQLKNGSKTDTLVENTSVLNRTPFQRGGWPDKDIIFQEPFFVPHEYTRYLPDVNVDRMHFEATGGISRWDSESGLKVSGFAVVTERGLTNKLVSLRPAKFIIRIVSEQDGVFNCRYGLALHDHLGVCITRFFSPADSFKIQKGQHRDVEIYLNPCQIGPGDYTIGISLHPFGPIEQLNNSSRYDLLSRSFIINVELPESYAAIESAFFHSAEWLFTDLPKV
jgi:lipopolysaccharide transport system ATP-binding protein